MNKKISIITINYNDRIGLEKTIESVVNQTCKYFEFIIIDGNSSDGSVDAIKKNANQIDYWISEKDTGIYNAMNKGIKVAKGEYLIFLNSGDHFYDFNVLEKNIEKIVTEDIICFDINVIGGNLNFVKKCPDEISFSYMFEESLPHQSIFIRKKLFDEIGYYDENVNVISDWKFFIIAFFSHKATYKHINSVLSTFYLGGISSFGDYSNDRRLVLQENFEGFVNDYDELIKNRNELKQLKSYHKTNRVKMLKEIEKTALGRNFLSIFFRIYIITFSKNKLKQIIK